MLELEPEIPENINVQLIFKEDQNEKRKLEENKNEKEERKNEIIFNYRASPKKKNNQNRGKR